MSPLDFRWIKHAHRFKKSVSLFYSIRNMCLGGGVVFFCLYIYICKSKQNFNCIEEGSWLKLEKHWPAWKSYNLLFLFLSVLVFFLDCVPFNADALLKYVWLCYLRHSGECSHCLLLLHIPNPAHYQCTVHATMVWYCISTHGVTSVKTPSMMSGVTPTKRFGALKKNLGNISAR